MVLNISAEQICQEIANVTHIVDSGRLNATQISWLRFEVVDLAIKHNLLNNCTFGDFLESIFRFSAVNDESTALLSHPLHI